MIYQGEPPKVESIDTIIKDFAKKAETIYENGTAGDYTWEGFLTAFLRTVRQFEAERIIWPAFPHTEAPCSDEALAALRKKLEGGK